MYTSVAEDLNSGPPRTNQARAGLESETAGLRVQRTDHSATLHGTLRILFLSHLLYGI